MAYDEYVRDGKFSGSCISGQLISYHTTLTPIYLKFREKRIGH